MKKISTYVGAAGFALSLMSSVSFAQQSATTRIRAQIEKADGNVLMVKARDGANLKIVMPENARVAAMVRAQLADLKADTYIGVTAMPQADGTQKAIAIHIFQPSQRGTGEGFRPWDLTPGSTMTNAAIDSTVGGVDGQVITLKYKQGEKIDEKKVLVTPQTAIVRYVPGDKNELSPGVHIIVGAASKKEDGSYEAPAVNYGRDGIVPPM